MADWCCTLIWELCTVADWACTSGSWEPGVWTPLPASLLGPSPGAFRLIPCADTSFPIVARVIWHWARVRPTIKRWVEITELYMLVFWLTIWQGQVKPVGCNTRAPNESVQLVIVDLAVLDYLGEKLSLVDISMRPWWDTILPHTFSCSLKGSIICYLRRQEALGTWFECRCNRGGRYRLVADPWKIRKVESQGPLNENNVLFWVNVDKVENILTSRADVDELKRSSVTE